MKLVIELSLDNEAMTEPLTIAAVISKIAEQVEGSIDWTEHNDDGSYTAVASSAHYVRDPNGNTVGYWQVKVS